MALKTARKWDTFAQLRVTLVFKNEYLTYFQTTTYVAQNCIETIAFSSDK